jgi:hypothetical protein
MVTDQQTRRLYKLSNTEDTQEIAASKAAMDVKTARKYLRARRLPSERKWTGTGGRGKMDLPKSRTPQRSSAYLPGAHTFHTSFYPSYLDLHRLQ